MYWPTYFPHQNETLSHAESAVPTMGGVEEELLVNSENHLEITHILGMKHIFPLINKVLSGGLNIV